MLMARPGTPVFRADDLRLLWRRRCRAHAEELLERDNACAEMPARHLSHRNALHDAATAHWATAQPWGGSAMGLSAWEQQVLDSIRDHLVISHPGLTARLALFTRLTSDE